MAVEEDLVEEGAAEAGEVEGASAVEEVREKTRLFES